MLQEGATGTYSVEGSLGSRVFLNIIAKRKSWSFIQHVSHHLLTELLWSISVLKHNASFTYTGRYLIMLFFM